MTAWLLLLLAPQDEVPRDRRDDYRPPGYIYAKPPNPWGASGWELGDFRIRPVGVFVHGLVAGGDDLRMDVPVAFASRSDGVNPPLNVRYDYDKQSFDVSGAGISLDLDGLRFGFDWFTGDFEAEGVLTVDDGVNPLRTTRTGVEGEAVGFRFSASWPGIRHRSEFMEASIGPAVGVGWLHEEIDGVSGSPLAINDETDQLLVTYGARVSLRAFWGRASAALEGELHWIAGDSEGVGGVVTLGLGWAF
jgi:hypothetical protein